MGLSLRAVLPRKDWRPEHVLRITMIMMISWVMAVGLASVVAAARHQQGEPVSPLVLLVVVGLAFHGVGFVAVVWLLRHEGRTWNGAFGLNQAPRNALKWAFGATALVAPLIYGVHFLSAAVLRKFGVDPAAQSAIELLIQSNWPARALIALFAVFFAPVVEELVFRGLIFPVLRDFGFPRIAWWGTALAFGFIHGNAAAFLPLSLFGFILAWLYVRTGNLLTSIVAHALFNLIPFAMVSLGFNLEP